MPSRPTQHRPPWVKPKAERLRDLRHAYDQQRPNSGARGYDAAWRELRAAFISVHPICCIEGCNAPTTDVDHFLSVASHPHLRLVWQNLRPFCHPHHSAHTARAQGFAKGKA